MTLFHGLSAFPITPTDGHGVVDRPTLAKLVERLCSAAVDSIGLLGSTGGYAYLGRAERLRGVETAASVCQHSVPLIVGIGALATDEAIGLARDAAGAGASGLLLAPVSYTPLLEEEVYQHFAAVAAATPLPLCIYNNPATTHFTFSPALLARLAALATIEAVKMPLPSDGDVGGELAQLREITPSGFAIGYSGDWGAADAMLAGGDAWYSVVGGLLPVSALRLLRAAKAGDTAETRRLDQLFQPLWHLFKEFGSIRVIHAAAEHLQLTTAAPPRPILPLDARAHHRVAEALAALGEG